MNQIIYLPLIAGAIAVAASLYLATKSETVSKNSWIPFAFFSAIFLALSIQAVMSEGAFGFWPEHTRNLWGNQIWYDLLLAVVAALAFIIPRAKAIGMNVLPWTLLTLATGSIGLYAFMARLLYLESRKK